MSKFKPGVHGDPRGLFNLITFNLSTYSSLKISYISGAGKSEVIALAEYII